MEWITTTDIHILFGLHRLAGPHMDAFITYFTTVINTLWLWAILAAAGLWKRRSRWVTLTIIVAVILAILVGDVAIKHFVMRIRPYLVIPGAPTLDTLKYPISYSFPSGHSFFFFAGATVLFRSCRRLGIAAYGLACVVAFSRMYLFMHFPSDVLTVPSWVLSSEILPGRYAGMPKSGCLIKTAAFYVGRTGLKVYPITMNDELRTIKLLLFSALNHRSGPGYNGAGKRTAGYFPG